MAQALPDNTDSDFSDDNISPLDAAFQKATNHVRKITNKLESSQLLMLYGLYKQGTEGPCNTPKPGWFDMKGKQKWEAWKSNGDISNEEAKQNYINLLQKYDPEFLEIQETNTKETWVAVSSLRHSPEPDLAENELNLIEAARDNCQERVKQLLKQNPEMRYEKDENGLTALHWAADRDATGALQAAIDGGCVVDAVDDSGQTALHYAAACGNLDSAKILLKAGASFLKDNDSSTPLDVAHDDEIKKILEGAI